MGSGISAPNPKGAELETHEDLMEVRFDHLAFGGTAMILITLCAIVYCICKGKRKNKAQQNQQPRTWYPGPIIMPTPSPYVPWMHPMQNLPMNRYGQMDIIFDPQQQAALYRPQRPPPYDGHIAEQQDCRFTELTVNNNTTSPTGGQGQRPERPRLPSPQRNRLINPNRSIQETTN